MLFKQKKAPETSEAFSLQHFGTLIGDPGKSACSGQSANISQTSAWGAASPDSGEAYSP